MQSYILILIYLPFPVCLSSSKHLSLSLSLYFTLYHSFYLSLIYSINTPDDPSAMSAQKADNPGAGLAEAAGGGAKGTPASTLTPTTATSAPATVGTSIKSPVQLPVTVKTEPGTTNGKRDDADPAEICVVIGGNDVRGGARAAQTQGMFTHGTPPPTKNTDSCIGVCEYIYMCITRHLCCLPFSDQGR